MDRDAAARLYEQMLLGLWHADDDVLDGLADAVAHDDLVIHQNGNEQYGASALVDLVRQGRAPFTGVAVAIDAGPVIDGDLVAARWSFSGSYAGGIPGATAEPGTAVSFCGHDLVRVTACQVVEYWVCSDGQVLMAQLGVSG